MAITQNNITFNDLSRLGLGTPIGNIINGDVRTESDLTDYIDAGEEYRNIQSVLIDWNAANLGNYVNIDANGGKSNGNSAVINTTGALLSYISALAQRIDNIESVSIYPFRRICNPVA